MSAEPMKLAFADAHPAPVAMVPQPLTYSRATRPGGDQETMIRQYLPLVRRIAWHVHGSMSTIVDVEDLVQIGLVALVEAVGQAAEQGAQFRAYLQTRLRGAISPGGGELHLPRQRLLQPGMRGGLDLAHACRPHAQHLADLLEVQFLDVI